MNIKKRITLHSFVGAFGLLILFLLTLLFTRSSGFQFSVAVLLMAEALRIVFGKRKYITSVRGEESGFTVIYLTRRLSQKSIRIDKIGLDVCEIEETNRWLGMLDRINLSNGKLNVTFECIDRQLMQSITETLEHE